MKKISVPSFILILVLFLVTLRFEYFFDTAALLVIYLRMLFYDFDFAAGQMNFQLADTFLSLILIILIPAGVIFHSRVKKFIKQQLSFGTAIIIILLMFFFFAPAISSYHPEFQKNISVTKLLPPFSSVIIVKTKEESVPGNIKDKFLMKRMEVVREPFNDNIIFVSSMQTSGGITRFYQKDKEVQLSEKSEVHKTIFLLGTDQYGRDVFSRLIYGARVSLFVGFGAVLVSFFLGFTIGFAAGYPGGIIDIILNRISDIFLSFPVIFLIILILALFGNSLFTVIIVLGLSGWMSMFKIVRTEVMSIKKKDFFISARMAGLSPFKLMFKEALPVVAVPVIVNLIFQFANVIMAEAALSYLGLGTGGSYPSWGSMIESSQGYLPDAWWMIIAPAFLLIITLYTANDTGKMINQKLLRKAYDQPSV